MVKGYRAGRIGEEIRKIISNMLLRELKDPRLSAMISISAVEVTKDNSYATCFVTIFNTESSEEDIKEKQTEVIEGLNSAKGLIRKEIGQKMKLRHVPELIFKIDHSMEYGNHIDDILRKLEKNHD